MTLPITKSYWNLEIRNPANILHTTDAKATAIMIYSIFIFLYPRIITPYHIKISADLVPFHKVGSYKDAPSDPMAIHIFHKKYP